MLFLRIGLDIFSLIKWLKKFESFYLVYCLFTTALFTFIKDLMCVTFIGILNRVFL